MAELSAFLCLSFLLCHTLVSAGRPLPASEGSPAKAAPGADEAARAEAVDESCEGVAEEECLNRRTLAAHLDYIYTQSSKP